jgi:hypothetical protein
VTADAANDDRPRIVNELPSMQSPRHEPKIDATLPVDGGGMHV